MATPNEKLLAISLLQSETRYAQHGAAVVIRAAGDLYRSVFEKPEILGVRGMAEKVQTRLRYPILK